MLTIHPIKIASGDAAAARRAAAYPLQLADSPRAFRPGGPGEVEGGGAGGGGARPSAVWLGSSRLLEKLGVERGGGVSREQLELALQGRNATNGKRVRREGRIGVERVGVDGRKEKVQVRGTRSVDMTFSVPKSVSIVWSQASPELRARIERAVVVATDTMLEHWAQTKPVVWEKGKLVPARGYAASLALHVTARPAEGAQAPSPQLHVHSTVVGVERADGFFASPDLSGAYRDGAPLELGAVGRMKLAEQLIELGFEIESGVGPRGRYFRIAGIPKGLEERMSGRSRDVERRRAEVAREKGQELSNREAAKLALETRRSKSDLSVAETEAVWRAHCEDFELAGAEAMDGLAGGSGRHVGELEERRQASRQYVLARMRERGPMVSPGEALSFAFECADRLGYDEAAALLTEMERAGELVALANGKVTSGQIRAAEEYVIGVAGRAGRSTGEVPSAGAVERARAAAERGLGDGRSLGKDQRDAIERLTEGPGWSVLTGRAGTGKGPVLQAVAEAHRGDGWRVLACAVDGTTAQQLARQLGTPAGASGRAAYTLEMLAYHLEHGILEIDERTPTLIVIEEASKVGLKDWLRVARLVDKAGARVLAVGHDGQLGAIELPGMFTEMLDEGRWGIPQAKLEQIHRHRDPRDPSKPHPWLGAYQIAIDKGEAEEAMGLLRANDAVTLHDTRAQAMVGMVEEWDQTRRRHRCQPGESVMVIHGSNQEVDEINELAQERRQQRDELKGEGVEAVDRSYRIYEGDVVALRERAYDARAPAPGSGREPRVENGAVGIVVAVDSERDRILVEFDEPTIGRRQVAIDMGALRERRARGEKVAAPRLGYAWHVYPVQGATFKFVSVLDGHRTQHKEAGYPADTRGALGLHKHGDRESFGTGRSREECFEQWGRVLVDSRRKDASISAVRDPSLELSRAIADAEPLPPELGTKADRARWLAARAVARADQRGERERDPLERYRGALGVARAAVIERRARALGELAASLGGRALRGERAEAAAAFDSFDPVGARETLRLQREQSRARVRTRGARREPPAGERRRLRGWAEDEQRLREEGRHLDDWVEREGERVAWWVALERELAARRQRRIEVDLELAGVDPSRRAQVLLGEPPQEAGAERDEYEALAAAIERGQIEAALGEEWPQAAADGVDRRELEERIELLREKRGLAPLDAAPEVAAAEAPGLER